MRKIVKSAEPNELTEHRARTHSTFDNLDKKQVRTSLITEQRGICCYCMCRIKDGKIITTKIEHYQCQRDHPELELTYSNLLLACSGGEGNPPDKQHCDTAKGHAVLSRCPSHTAPNIEHLIGYRADGTIYATESTLDEELNEVLNLNLVTLKNYRKDVLDALKLAFGKGKLSTRELQTQLQKWTGEDHGRPLKPYCGVVIYWLRKRMART